MNRFFLFSLAAAVLTACGGSGSVDLGDEYAGLGWRPVDLAAEGVTKIYATDYLLSELDEWTFPEGLTVKWQQDSAIWRVEGRMKQPLGVASIEAAADGLHDADRSRTGDILGRARQQAAAGNFHEAVAAAAEALSIYTRAIERARGSETARIPANSPANRSAGGG